jgi:hypothetical protein
MNRNLLFFPAKERRMGLDLYQLSVFPIFLGYKFMAVVWFQTLIPSGSTLKTNDEMCYEVAQAHKTFDNQYFAFVLGL